MRISLQICCASTLAVAMSGAALGAETPATPATAVRKVAPDHLAHYWLLLPDSAQANVPNSGAGLDAPTCAAVSYVIEKNGTTSQIKLERIAPPGPLGKVAVNIVAGMRFVPGADNAGKDAVATYVVIPFNLADPTSPKPEDKALRTRTVDACQLPDFLPPRQ